jgi:hypothetical protein
MWCAVEDIEAMCSSGDFTELGVASGAVCCVRARKKQNSPNKSSTTKDIPMSAVRMTPNDKLGASVWTVV